MDKAKAAIHDFMSKSGHHDTTVHETVAPAVKEEVVKPHVHEEVNTVIDKEIHKDHYHRTVQPIQDREVLPEQHTAQLGAVQHREFDHRDTDAVKRNLAAEQAAFKNQRVVEGTTHSQSAAPAIAGEHVHHHIHETIQPVVYKETIQPNVVHTTVPIHEVHHNAASHHETSELPVMTMEEFKQKGGVLSGRGERYDGFEGEPKHIGGTLQNMMEGKHSKHDSGHHNGMHDPLDGGHTNREAGRLGGTRGIDGVGATGAAGVAGAGASGKLRRGSNSSLSSSDEEAGVGKTRSKIPTSTSSGTAANTKPKASILDKLNPTKDSNGDGQAGFMK